MATNLYISSTGNDSNNGLSPSTPFRTAQKAFNVAWFRTDACVLNFADYVGGDYGGIDFAAKDAYAINTAGVAMAWWVGVNGGIAFAPNNGSWNNVTNYYDNNTGQENPSYTIADYDNGFEWVISGSDGSSYYKTGGSTPWEGTWNSGLGSGIPYFQDNTWPSRITIVGQSVANTKIGGITARIVNGGDYPNVSTACWACPSHGGTWDITASNCDLGNLASTAGAGQDLLGTAGAASINLNGVTCGDISVYGGNGVGTDASAGGSITLNNSHAHDITNAGGNALSSGYTAGSGGTITLNASTANSVNGYGGYSVDPWGRGGVGGTIVLNNGSVVGAAISTTASQDYPANAGDITISNSSASVAISIGGWSNGGGSAPSGTIHLVGNVSPVPTTLLGNVDLSQFSPSGGGNGGFISSLLRLPFPITI